MEYAVKGMYSSFSTVHQMGNYRYAEETSIAPDAAYRQLAAVRGRKLDGGWVRELRLPIGSSAIPYAHRRPRQQKSTD